MTSIQCQEENPFIVEYEILREQIPVFISAILSKCPKTTEAVIGTYECAIRLNEDDCPIAVCDDLLSRYEAYFEFKKRAENSLVDKENVISIIRRLCECLKLPVPERNAFYIKV